MWLFSWIVLFKVDKKSVDCCSQNFVATLDKGINCSGAFSENKGVRRLGFMLSYLFLLFLQLAVRKEK